jgi:nascent polypeptide-associated complex subunit alpha
MAYKALKAARGGMPGGRDTIRMMQKMGMKVDEISDVSQVVIRTPAKDIVIESPNVTLVTVQGQAMYQIAVGTVSESKPQPSAGPSDDDVKLVSQQSGKSMEDSRRALAEAGGDLAKAILLLKGQTV